MKPKLKTFKGEAFVTMEKMSHSGMYLVQGWNDAGRCFDKIRCDDYRNALAYFKSFCAIARNATATKGS